MHFIIIHDRTFQIILVAAVLALASADPFFHKKAAILGSPALIAPQSRIVERTVEVIKPVEVIKEVPVIRQVEVIKEVPVEVVRTVEVEKPVEVIRHGPVVRTVIQRVAVPYPVHIQRRVPFPVHVERHIPVPVTVERLHTPIVRNAPYEAPVTPEPTVIVPEPEHPLHAKFGHFKGLLKGHSIHKRSPILHKIKRKFHAKKAAIKGKLVKLFG